VLPVQCLCEFLLNDSLSASTGGGRDDEGGASATGSGAGPGGGAAAGKAKKQRKAGELLLHLQQLLQNPNSDPASCLETLDYFLRRLASLLSPARLQALSGLKLLLTPEQPGEEDRLVAEDDSGMLDLPRSRAVTVSVPDLLGSVFIFLLPGSVRICDGSGFVSRSFLFFRT
jgi:hypothetical protein